MRQAVTQNTCWGATAFCLVQRGIILDAGLDSRHENLTESPVHEQLI